MIRSALLATAAFAIALPAFAQDAAAPPAPPAPAAAPPAASTAPADATAPAAPAPAAAPQVAAAPPEPPPVLPTTGDGAVVVGLLNNVCKPLVAGGDFEKLVKAQRMKQDGKTGEWILPLSQKPYQIAMTNPGANNKGLCDMRIRYAVGYDQPIIEALNIWRFLQNPQLHGQRNEQANYPDVQRVTTTWDNWENQMLDGKMIGLVLVQLNKLDGTPNINAGYDEAIVKFQIRAPQQLDGVATTASSAPPAPAQPAG
jgi:hypothetical protein